MYVQMILLGAMAFLQIYNEKKSIIAFLLLIALEFGVLEFQRRENKDAVYYVKSCWFALFDLISVLIFFMYFGFLILSYDTVLLKYMPILFIYILVRKYYITKNYSYEK